LRGAWYVPTGQAAPAQLLPLQLLSFHHVHALPEQTQLGLTAGSQGTFMDLTSALPLYASLMPSIALVPSIK
jgi:hypothetical protein